MGHNSFSSIQNYYATDYMLGTILLENRSLFINTFYLYKLDASKVINRRTQHTHSRTHSNLLNSKKNDLTIGCTSASNTINIQSAENCKGFSETVRQFPDYEEDKF